jgi:propane monooxygenase reductase subunit
MFRKAVINRIEVASLNGLVKRFWLTTADREPLVFFAGQWLDVVCPGVDRVGGFSLVSAPSISSGEFQLAVKRSPHAAAAWMTETAAVGDHVDVSVGGSVFFDPEADQGQHLHLLAGGVGVNPLWSIAQAAVRSRRVSLFYSCKADEELFRDDIEELEKSNGDSFQITRFIDRRIGIADLADVRRGDVFFICGPSGFADAMQEHLAGMGVTPDKMRCERWW